MAQPFRIDIPEAELDDLRRRIAATRWPDEVDGAGWDYGTNLDYLRGLADYWLREFDWRQQERRLNELPQFTSDVDGQTLHFVHVRGQGPNPMPLLITHGWPSTFWEMYKLIPLLADPASYGGDPADAFDVVAPSMPGYGFSAKPTSPGMSYRRVADLFARLMTDELGYARFGAHGGDWGGAVTSSVAHAHPNEVIGAHVTLVIGAPHLGPGTAPLSDGERAFLAERDEWRSEEGGYGHIQGTKPQTLAFGLADSPVGLAGWIVEKFRTWSDCGGDVEGVYTRDELLTNISIYWLTGTVGSSVRLYYESQRDPLRLDSGERILPPAAVTTFPKEISHPPREWCERIFADLRRFSKMPSGGHFAALETPGALADEIRGFFRELR